MTLKELKRYCMEQFLRQVEQAERVQENHEMQVFCLGRAAAFAWIAECIQNDNLPAVDKEKDSRRLE